MGALHATTPLFTQTDLQVSSRMFEPIYLPTFGLAFVLNHMLSACRSRCFVVLVGTLPGRLVGGNTRAVRPAWSQSAITVTCRSCKMPCKGSPRPCGLTLAAALDRYGAPQPSCTYCLLISSCFGQAMCAVTLCRHTVTCTWQRILGFPVCRVHTALPVCMSKCDLGACQRNCLKPTQPLCIWHT